MQVFGESVLFEILFLSCVWLNVCLFSVFTPIFEAKVSCFSLSELHSCLPLSIGEILLCYIHYIHCAGYWRKSLGLKPRAFQGVGWGISLCFIYIYIIELVHVLNIAEILFGGHYATNQSIYIHMHSVYYKRTFGIMITNINNHCNSRIRIHLFLILNFISFCKYSWNAPFAFRYNT